MSFWKLTGLDTLQSSGSAPLAPPSATEPPELELSPPATPSVAPLLAPASLPLVDVPADPAEPALAAPAPPLAASLPTPARALEPALTSGIAPPAPPPPMIDGLPALPSVGSLAAELQASHAQLINAVSMQMSNEPEEMRKAMILVGA